MRENQPEQTHTCHAFVAGTPALTSRAFLNDDFVRVAEFVDRGVKIAQEIQAKSGKKTLKAFNETRESGDFGIEGFFLSFVANSLTSIISVSVTVPIYIR